MDYNRLCNKILKLNSQIRFTGILNSRGDLVAQKNRDFPTLLSVDELNMLIHYTFERWSRLQNLEYKLGKEKTSITEYEKVIMISLAFVGGLFLLSIEPGSNYSKIVSNIRSILNKNSAKKKLTRKTLQASTSKKQSSKKKTLIRPTKKYTISEVNSRLQMIEKKIDSISSAFFKN